MQRLWSFGLVGALMLMMMATLPAKDLHTISGKTYSNFKLMRILPDGIQISHDGGVSKVPIEDLQEDDRIDYVLEVMEAKRAQEAKTARDREEAEKQRLMGTVEDRQAEQAAVIQRERVAAVEAAQAELMRRLKTEAKPFFTVDKTTFVKVGGGIVFAGRGTLVPTVDGKMLVNNAVCEKANPNVMPAADFRENQVLEIGKLEQRLKDIPEQIGKLEAQIADWEREMTALRAAGRAKDAPLPFDLALRANDIKRTRKEIRQLEKDRETVEKNLDDAKKVLKQIDGEMEKFAEQQKTGA